MENVLFSKKVDTPFGPVFLLADSESIVYLAFDNDRARSKRERHITTHFKHHVLSNDSNAILTQAESELNEYFERQRTDFSVPVKLRGTDYQSKVWAEIARIPYGTIITYQMLASAAGNKNGSRGAGAACGANPVAIIVPCHRVIGTNRKLTGFGGGMETKIWLLRHEGSVIENERWLSNL